MADESTLGARFVADAARALAGALSVRRAAARAASLAVPALADAAVVGLAEPGTVRLVSAHDNDPAHVRELTRLPLENASPALDLLRAVLDGRQSVLAVPPPEGIDVALATGPTGIGPPAAAALFVPLLARGETLGVLSLLRGRGRPGFAPADVELAEQYAAHAALAMGTARLYAERAELVTTLTRSLRPAPLPTIDGAALGATYRPAHEATEIGGDFYDVYRAGDGGWAFMIGDVCGKGVDAAVLTGMARQSLRTASLIESSPAAALHLLNRALLEADGTKFVTLVHGRITPLPDGAVRLVMAGAGHPRPLLRRADGSVEAIDTGGMIAGMLRDAAFRDTELILQPGETCLVYTDGVVEARVDGVELGSERLMTIYSDCSGMPPQHIVERIEQSALEFLRGQPHDDIALIAIQAQPEENR